MTDQLFDVSRQIVLVSGGSRGIGRSIAEGFAERGARVIVTGRHPDTLEKMAGEVGLPTLETSVCDVADTAATTALAQQVAQRHGRIDTLINVAGINRRKPATDITEQDYDDVVNINQKGAFFLSQAVGKQMIEQGQGCQINIASLNADRPLKHVAPYALSKMAMAAMTRALALEWGPHGVRVNALAPGFILTDLTRTLWADETMQAWGVGNTPMRRLGRPADMVGTAVFLASPAAAFLTGQIIYVDGGFTAGWAWPIPEAP